MLRVLPALLLLALAGCGQARPAATPAAAAAAGCLAPSAIGSEIALFFGRDKPGGEVSEAEWLDFLDQVVVPAFPDGLTALDAAGRWLDRDVARTISERSKVVLLFVADRAAAEPAIAAIAAAYRQRFQQQSVLTVERPACIAFR
jgi:hypothetical protein